MSLFGAKVEISRPFRIRVFAEARTRQNRPIPKPVFANVTRCYISVLTIAFAVIGPFSSANAQSADPTESGRQAAQTYCGSCHELPSPEMLTKSDWLHGALRNMAFFLGVSRPNLDNRPDGALLREAKIFPDAPLLSKAEWQSIVAYYTNAAPAQAAAPARIHQTADLFKPSVLLRSSDAPCTTLLQFDRPSQTIYVGDAQTRTLKALDSRGHVLTEWETDSGPVALTRDESGLIVTLVGRILPSDEMVGQIWKLDLANPKAPPVRLLRGLRRPVHTSVVNLDKQAPAELVVSCFGNRLGQLSVFTANPGGGYSERVIYDLAGAVRALPFDWNGDGALDLTLLRAQAREGVDLYLNQAEGGFARQPLWEDPSAYGNAFMDLVDFDRDRRPELVVLNGDNGDFNCAPKPYHGIRIFGVDRTLRPVLRFRFAFPGAYGARAADFDLDGDTDLVAVSFFPDYLDAPEQNFVYLRNDGDWRFTPHRFPGLDQGRWIMVEAGDIDADGDSDVLLGSFSRGPLTIPIPDSLRRRWETDRVAVLLLENKTK